MTSEVYISTRFKEDLGNLSPAQQKKVAKILDSLETDPIANSKPVEADAFRSDTQREIQVDGVHIVFRYVPEESAVILTSLRVGESLTDQQIMRFAQTFHDLAVELAQVRLNALAAGIKLSDSRVVQLQGIVYSLLNTSSGFALQAPDIRFVDSDIAVAAIAEATVKASERIDKLRDLNEAINIGSSLIVLGMAMAARSSDQVLSAANGVSKAAA
jgi:mRNA-degrading endonuclease RelE of RelBE toxin-antitoxin system